MKLSVEQILKTGVTEEQAQDIFKLQNKSNRVYNFMDYSGDKEFIRKKIEEFKIGFPFFKIKEFQITKKEFNQLLTNGYRYRSQDNNYIFFLVEGINYITDQDINKYFSKKIQEEVNQEVDQVDQEVDQEEVNQINEVESWIGKNKLKREIYNSHKGKDYKDIYEKGRKNMKEIKKIIGTFCWNEENRKRAKEVMEELGIIDDIDLIKTTLKAEEVRKSLMGTK